MLINKTLALKKTWAKEFKLSYIICIYKTLRKILIIYTFLNQGVFSHNSRPTKDYESRPSPEKITFVHLLCP